MPIWKNALAALAIVLAPAADGCNLPFEPTLESALAKAKTRNQPVFLLFTGSDWSLRSVKLDKELLEHQTVEALLESSFVPVLVDFPQRVKLAPAVQRANRHLAEKFQVKHFPTMIALDREGKEIGRLEFQSGTVESLLAVIEKWIASSKEVR